MSIVIKHLSIAMINITLYMALIALSFSVYSKDRIIYEKTLHDDSVDSICLKNNSFVTSSFDGFVKEHSKTKSSIVYKHNDWSRKILCVKDVIISSSNTGVISISEKTKKNITVLAHDWWVSDMVFDTLSNKLVTISLDETIKVWSYPSLKLLHESKIYGSHKHHSVALSYGKAFIGSTNGWVFSLYSMHGNKYPWTQFQIAPSHVTLLSATSSPDSVFFGGSDGYVYQIDVDKFKLISKIKVSDSAIKAIYWHSNKLYIGSDDGRLVSISVNPMRDLSVLDTFNEAIRTIAINDNRIYMGFDKGVVRIYEYRDI